MTPRSFPPPRLEKRGKKGRKSTAARGYGSVHQRLRKDWAAKVRAGAVDCPRCGRPIAPSEQWDLGHSDDRTYYTGPEHAVCNRRAAAIKGNRERDRVKVTSRNW
jgi:hypothetical protein